MTRKRWLLILVPATVILGLLLWHLLSFREVNELDGPSRAAVCKSQIVLSDGVTCYQVKGPSDGPLLVLIHGATIPSWDFDPQFDIFARAGFRVVRYDMYGRGYSDRPLVEYDRELYLRQLRELLDALAPDRPVSLLGHSFGGAIAAAFAAQEPDRISSLVFLSPVINSVSARAPFIVVRLPLIDRLLVRTIMVSAVRDRARNQYVLSDLDVGHYDRLFNRQTTYRGFEHALRSMFETDAIGDYRDDYRKIGKAGIPAMLVWGDRDEDITPELAREVKTWIPGLVFEEFEGVAHAPNIEKPERFNRVVMEFLRQMVMEGTPEGHSDRAAPL